MMIKHKKTYKKRIKLILKISFIWFLIWYINCIPNELFDASTSLVIVDENDQLLGAHVAKDEQWRFPENKVINEKFEKAIITYEDKRFYNHIGVDIWSLGRAIKSNLSQNRVVSGASTLTMQVVRLSRKNPSRSYFEKITEIFRATRIEMRYNKKEILSLYASHAPFGGNVVGLDAASWKYFGKDQSKLSWAEACMLAVLPNAPGMIHLSKNREKLLAKRNLLLDKLFVLKHIDASTCQLAKMESLPNKPKSIPQIAPHVLTHFLLQQKQGKVSTTINLQYQEKTSHIIQQHVNRLKGQAIHNACAIVVDVKTGNIISYVGNTSDEFNAHHNSVDMNRAKRSTGSILKPLLYAESLEKGHILPKTLLNDIPIDFYGYTPKNFNLTYDGAVPANQMISKSLNIPSVNLLNQYGIHSFLHKLKGYGFHSINKSGHHYGLPLILGGAEVTPLEVAKVYTAFAQKMSNNPSKLSLVKHEYLDSISLNKTPSKSSIWHTFDAMLEVSRPGTNNSWKVFNNDLKIAWKTGTSFGGRDAWAIGCNPNYVVVVWTGNADGEGRPKLSGVTSASPILFDIFNQLPKPKNWFEYPVNEATQLLICSKSGQKANHYCTNTTEEYVPKNGEDSAPCGYCHTISLDSSMQFQVTGSDYPPLDRVQKTFFTLHPIQAYYYKKKHADYEPLPPSIKATGELALIYPIHNAKIYLPKKDSNTRSQLVLKGRSDQDDDNLFWTLDDQFVGTTNGLHELPIAPEAGIHELMVANASGNRKKIMFEVLE